MTIILTYQDIERICEWFRCLESSDDDELPEIEPQDRALYDRLRGAKGATT
jgi:hypothetical protein